MVSASDGVRPPGGPHRPNDDRPDGSQQDPTLPLQPSPRLPGRFAELAPTPRGTAIGGVSLPVRRPPGTIAFSYDGLTQATRSQRKFLEDIGSAPRASEVVRSLFAQAHVSPEAMQGFAEAYANEVGQERGQAIARSRYATLAELAESSGLNESLGVRYGVLNVSLDFDDESDAYVKACSARLDNRSQFVVGHGNGAHQTAHQIPIDMDRRDEVLARCKDIVRHAGITQFVARGVQHRINEEGMVEIFYGATKAERRQWVVAANPFIVGLKDFAVMPVTTPPGRIIDDAFIDAQFAAGDLDVLFNLYYARFAEIPDVNEGGIGMPANSGSRFNPHSTYGKLWEPPSNTRAADHYLRRLQLSSPEEGGGTVKYVSIYEMGPNGTVIGEPLLRIELPRA